MHVCLFQPNMPSVIVMQELEAYWKRQGEIPYELFAPRFEILRHGNTKRRYGFIWDLLEKGIEDGCFRCDLDLNLTHAWISVSFSGMLIRIATNPESYHDSENGISAKQIINAYVEAVLAAINAQCSAISR